MSCCSGDNLRKKRKGAFWEDRYHATAVESEHHLFQCLKYIDLNMVRAGVVNHPSQWEFSGYTGIQNPRRKNVLIAYQKLAELTGFDNYETDILFGFLLRTYTPQTIICLLGSRMKESPRFRQCLMRIRSQRTENKTTGNLELIQGY